MQRDDYPTAFDSQFDIDVILAAEKDRQERVAKAARCQQHFAGATATEKCDMPTDECCRDCGQPFCDFCSLLPCSVTKNAHRMARIHDREVA